MEKNSITFNGMPTDTFIEKSSARIVYLLGKQRKLGYHDNPPVAAVVNGELKSLQTEIPENAVIDLVYLNSKEGRTAYRKTLCFLLSYASTVVYPDRTLLVGHSLGDGYYFSYKNKEKPDIDKLKKVMEKAIEDDLIVDIETLSASQALTYVEKMKLKDTEKLLKTRNDGAYTFNRIGSALSVSYEPLLPSLKLLEVWDIMEYGGGILLRYPQSRDKGKIQPFQDNPLLFKVFEETKEKSKILDVDSLGALNMKVTEGKIDEVIVLSETLQRRRFSKAAEEIKKRGGVKVAFVSGPACSGKKSSGIKLCAELKILGYTPIMFSLDDYRTGQKGVSLESLDIELLRQHVSELMEGKEVELNGLSQYDAKRLFRVNKAKMDEKTILVVEGVQTLNEKLLPSLNDDETFRVFVSALTQPCIDTMSGISTRDNRLLRRIVKECRTKGVTVSSVIESWEGIEEEEKSQLFPYQNNADIMINSALEYELGVLSTYAMPLLRSIKPEEGKAYTTARRLMAFLDLVYPIPSEKVPSDSILREFIGGSVYNLT